MKLERQNQFLQKIAQARAGNVSFVSELADLLTISTDSAYRRLRGETSLTFDEISKLCAHYGISFDAFNATDSAQVVSFRYQPAMKPSEHFISYFGHLAQSMKQVYEAETTDKEIIYAGQGMPIFYYFKYPTLAAFKLFHWGKTGSTEESTNAATFDPLKIDSESLNLGKSLFSEYLKVPSIEIWSDTIVMGSIHQIRFYWDSGQFKSKQSALDVCQELKALLDYVQQMCVAGKKQDDFANPTIHGAPLQLYYSEIELDNVCALVRVGDYKRVYLGQLTFGSMFTEDTLYYHQTEAWLRAAIRKSNLISKVSQTIRHQFFKRSLKALAKLEEQIRDES